MSAVHGPSLPNRPTDERVAHGELLELPAVGTDQGPAQAGARMFRAISTIELLARNGTISVRQADAGERWRGDFELGVVGARNSATGHGGAAGWYYADARLNALRAYQLACNALGPHLIRVTEPICLGLPAGGNVTLAHLAIALQQNRQELTGILKVGLDTLADHYGMMP